MLLTQRTKRAKNINTHSLMREWEKSGWIGRVKPRDKDHAREIATMIASKQQIQRGDNGYE